MTVYFARAVGLDRIKIGFVQEVAADRVPAAVAKRMQQVGWLVGAKVELLATTPGKRRVERWFHLRHDAAALGGEWFGLSPELQADIDRLRAGEVIDGTPEALPYPHYKNYRWWEIVTPFDGRPYWAERRVKPRELRKAVERRARAA